MNASESCCDQLPRVRVLRQLTHRITIAGENVSLGFFPESKHNDEGSSSNARAFRATRRE